MTTTQILIFRVVHNVRLDKTKTSVRLGKEHADKLPFNGWKTVAGALLIALGAMLHAMPEYTPYIQVGINLPTTSERTQSLTWAL